MGLLLYKQQTGAFLSNSVQEQLEASLERWGSAQLITLRLELVVLSDIAIQRLIGYPDIQREVTVLAVRVGELREHIGDELQLGLNL